MLLSDPKLRGGSCGRKNILVSARPQSMCVFVCVHRLACITGLGEEGGKCITVRQNGKKKGVIVRDHYGSKKQWAVSELMM